MEFITKIRKIRKKWWFKWLCVGVVLRLVLMPITLHPDLWGHSFVAYFFSYKGVLNIYEHLLSLPQNHPLVTNFGVGDIFIYPPLTYFTLGFFRLLVRPFADPNFIPWLMENLGRIHIYKNLFWHLFLFKLPYLFLDILFGLIIAGFFNNQKNKNLAFVLWMVNPVTLYATFMIGQIDILPTLFSVLAIYFAKKKRFNWTMLALGIGGSYKMYPLFFIPVAAFIFGDNPKNKTKYLILGFLPYVLTIAPYLSSSAFRSMVLFSPKSQKILFMNWKVSGAEGIYPFILGLFFLYFHSYFAKTKASLQTYFLAILLLIFSTTHYHPQWFLWVTPFLIMELIERNMKHLSIVLSLISCWVLITLFFEPSLSIGLFNPIWPQLENSIGLTEIISKYSDVNQIKSIIRSVFAGASLYYVYTLMTQNDAKLH